MSAAAEIETVSAGSLMERLQSEARRADDPRRIGTLARLVEACDELLSGGAYSLAKSARHDPERFNPNFVKLNSKLIENYVRLRQRLEGGSSEWTGPVQTTIRKDKDLMTYLRLRAEEQNTPGRKKNPSPRRRKVDQVVDEIEGIHDQALLRETIAQGREWKTKLDVMLAALRKMPEIDIEALWAGKPQRPRVTGPASPSAIGADEAQLLRKLVKRLQDNAGLEDFQLVFRLGRLKMDGGTGLDLVYPTEMKLLERLAGFGEGGADGV